MPEVLSEPAAGGRPLRCPECKSTDLVLHETRFEHAEYNGGLFVNARGHLEAAERAQFTPGEIQTRLTRIECAGCGRDWHPRRPFDGAAAARKEGRS